MPLDLYRTAAQISEMASQMKERQSGWQARLQAALRTLEGADASAIEEKRRKSHVEDAWLVPEVLDGVNGRYPPPPPPSDFSVVAVDGSHIDVDRHAAARCYLINIGRVRLTYGSEANASLSGVPQLYAIDDDLVIRKPGEGTREQSIEGAVLGFKRTVEEVRALAQLAGESPLDTPTVALMDGSLIILGLIGQGYPDFVRDALLVHGFLEALDEIKAIAGKMTLGLASYVSLPRSPEAINALRVAACTFDRADCNTNCLDKRPGQRPCDGVGGLFDRDVFWKWLEPGQRSDVFKSTSKIVADHYGDHHAHFFYVKVGNEIGRVEIPEWVARDKGRLDLTHSVVVDQCRRGRGYPVALMEAHEQAVITGADRQRFQELVNESLTRGKLPVYSSAKSASKRMRWL